MVAKRKNGGRQKICINSGDKFLGWTIISEVKCSSSNKRIFLCKCVCGTKRHVYLSNLTTKKSKSCGCLRKKRSPIGDIAVHTMVEVGCSKCGRNTNVRWGRLQRLKQENRSYKCRSCACGGDGSGTKPSDQKIVIKCDGCGVERNIPWRRQKKLTQEKRSYKCNSCACGGDGSGVPYSRQKVESFCSLCGTKLTVIRRTLKKIKQEKRCLTCKSCSKRSFKDPANFIFTPTKTVVSVKCQKCQNHFEVRGGFINSLRRRVPCRDYTCRHCSRGGGSLEENTLRMFVREVIEEGLIEKNVRGLLVNKKLEIDIWLPGVTTGIEYNGNWCHSENMNSDSKRHLRKRELCEEQGIRLIQIRSDEWLNKREIIESILRSILNKTPHRYFARKLEIREVASQVACDFLESNHLMGSYRSSRHLGLFTSEGVLVQLFSYQLKKNQTEMDCSRICSLKNHSIVGGLSKLLKHALKKHPSVKKVVSFVDLRYADGHSLKKLGFKHTQTTLGWGWTDGIEWYNRLQCKADRKQGLTENEHASLKGWYRIYDAGQAKFEKKV